MKKSSFLVAALVTMGFSLVGCDNKTNIDAIACEDLSKITDATQRKELSKKCPRGKSGGFRPSPKKEW